MSPQAVTALIRRGTLKGFRPSDSGNHWRVTADEFEAYVERRLAKQVKVRKRSTQPKVKAGKAEGGE